MRNLILVSILYLLSISSISAQIISSTDSLSKYQYQNFNSAKLKPSIHKHYRSIANCYNFKTDGSNPVKIPNIYIALYDDGRQELGCLIDSTGKKLVDSIFYDLAFFNNTAIVLRKNKHFENEYSIVNSKGVMTTPFKINNWKDWWGAVYNPFTELTITQKNFDYYYFPIATYGPLIYPRFGLIDCSGKLLLDTIYSENYRILSNPKDVSKKGLLYENLVFKNDTSIAIVNYETGKIITKKWDSVNYILPIPLMYNKKQYYVYAGGDTTNDYGLIDNEGNVVLKNNYRDVLAKSFANAAFQDTEAVQSFCSFLYTQLSEINDKEVDYSFGRTETKDGNSKTTIINLPKYIFIRKNNLLGIFNMETLKIEVPCIYNDIGKNHAGDVFGYLKNGEEVLLKLN